MSSIGRSAVRGALFVGLLLGGCEDPVVAGPAVQPAPNAPVAPAPANAGQPPSADPSEAEEGALTVPSYDDDDFVELDVQNRDPFRGFASAFVVRVGPQEVQRRVLLGNIAVDDMRLIAIVTGLSQPRAMVLDPSNVGWVIKRGDFIGRADVVQAGGEEGMPVTLNWRVDRIRENEVVLTRDDPTAPNQPPLTRVLPLRPGEEPNPLLEQLDTRQRRRAAGVD